MNLFAIKSNKLKMVYEYENYPFYLLPTFIQ